MEEFKKLIAVKLLSWAYSVLPECDFKYKYSEFLKENILDL